MTRRGEVVVAIDVGGTSVKAALVDRTGGVVHRQTVATPPDPTLTLVDLVVEITAGLDAACQSAEAVAAGVVVPGIVDESAQMAIASVNLGWRDFALPELLRERLDLPVAFGHDVRSAAMAEARLGAARDSRDALFASIGTGIAAAISISGHVVNDPYAGEIGHVVVDVFGDRCTCGARGCLETVASCTAIRQNYRRRTGVTAETSAIAGAVAAGDVHAHAVWADAVESLGAVLAPCVASLALDLIVVGGGLAESGDVLLDPLRDALEARLPVTGRPGVVAAQFGMWAGCVGAAMHAWDLVA